MIPRKWEWVKDQCLRRGYDEAATLAGEIDDALQDCYNEQHTRKWRVICSSRDMNTLASRWDFMDIVTDSSLCMGCVASMASCIVCKYRAICGDCGDEDSTYRRFIGEVDKGWPIEKKRMIEGEGIEGINGI